MEKFSINRKQLFVVALLVIIFFVVMDLNSRLNDLFRLSAQRDQMQTEVSGLAATGTVLYTQIAYATSDMAVAQWAREQGGLGQPGDIPVIPLPPKDYTPSPSVLPTPTPQVVNHWMRWWALFFGK